MSTSLFIFRNIMSYPESHYDNIAVVVALLLVLISGFPYWTIGQSSQLDYWTFYYWRIDRPSLIPI